MSNKEELLGILNEKVKACTQCELLCNSRTQTVFGNGNPDAKILFLGEAPGRNEDKEGQPFVGRAGQLLNNMLQACGWNREDVYVCNILKCRPPHNRNPLPEEVANCSQYLEMQLRIVHPEFIVCLGATAAQNLLQVGTPIGKLRKRWFEYKNGRVKAKVLATYHPAYVLRNPIAKSDVWEDLQILMKEAHATLQST